MSLIVEEYMKALTFILDEGDIESDQYNNALSIKHTLEKLFKDSRISKFDARVINGVSSGFNFSEIAIILGADRKRVAESFRKTCNKISFLLGDEFTDVGFMYNVAAKYAIGHKKENELREFFK